MTQASLPLADSALAAEWDKAFRRAVGAALDHLQQDDFCKDHGFAPSDVSQGRNGKRQWQSRWTQALLASPNLPERFKVGILDALAAPAGLRTTKPAPVTVRDVAEEAIAVLAGMGPHLAPVADDLRLKLLAALAADRNR